jgi:hypothetical protein
MMPNLNFGCVRNMADRAMLRFGLLLPHEVITSHTEPGEGLQPCHYLHQGRWLCNQLKIIIFLSASAFKSFCWLGNKSAAPCSRGPDYGTLAAASSKNLQDMPQQRNGLQQLHFLTMSHSSHHGDVESANSDSQEHARPAVCRTRADGAGSVCWLSCNLQLGSSPNSRG